MQLVYLFQIAFIAGKADAFCDDVREFIKHNTKTELPQNLDGLDNLRKAIYVLAATRPDQAKVPEKDDESIYLRYVDFSDLSIVDYYRKLRNIQLHGGLSVNNAHPILTGNAAEDIKTKYKYKPNHLNNLTARDAILFSRSWQAIAVSVCRKLADINTIVQELCERHRMLTQHRRDNAITNALRQDYLQTDGEITRLRQLTNDWLA